jgi:VCBS repeat-containing protein
MFFTDVDLNDTHTPSHDNGTFTWSDGALTVAQQAALQAASTLDLTLNDSIDTGAGSVDFTYSAADSTFDFLAAGETLTASYQVTVTDDQSASSTETVTITITGSNDAPTAADDSNAVTANVNSASQPNPVSGNVLGNDSDPDTTDTLAVSAVDGSGANVGTGVTGTYGTLTLNGDGSYTYALANGQANVQALSAGEVVTDTFQYTASDGNGGTSTATLTISVTGSNVLPTITSFDDDTGVQGDSITADTTITLHGTSDAGTQTVTVFDGTTELGFATVAADGSWTFTTQTLEDALHSFTVTATDAASNVTAPSFPFLVTVSADAPNTGPTVTANPLNMVQDDVTLIQAAAGISAADADGNAVTQFQLFDDNSARGTDDNNLSPDTTGYFLINGVAQKAGVNIDVGPADLPNVQFVAGATSDILWIRATDGQTFGAWVSFTVTETPHGKPLVNQAPVVTAHNQAATHNQVFTAAQLILSVADPNGDTITKYQFFDDHDARGTADNNPLHDNSGYFLLNGQREPEGVSIEITADQFNHDALTYQSAVDTDILWARAYDGNLWSAWTSFQITADDHKPVIGVISDLTVDKNVTLAEADLGIPTPTDADGDPIAQYQFWDGNDATGSGYFVLDGVDQAARQNVTVDAADLTHLTFQTDNVGTDTLWVRASDGVAWSDWVSFDVTATNTAPVVTGHNVPPLATNSDTVAVSSLFTVADANSDTITKYQLWDDNGARGTGDDHSSPDNTGHFVVNGVAETAGHAIDVSAAEIANSVFANGTVGSTEILWERAFDGTDWSNWTSVSITETHNAAVPGNEAPTVAVGDITVTTSAETFNASQLVTATDADNDAITAYQFFDDHQLPGTAENNPTNDISGHFVLNGEALTEGQHIEITADQFNANALTFQSGSGDDLLWVRAFDGQDWGAWASFHVDAPTNTAPAITTPTSLSVAANDSFAAGDLVTHVTDPDLGAHVAQYEFWDSTQTATSGHFEVNGAAQGSNAAIDVVAADLDHASFVAGSQPGTDQVWVRVNDGIEWSAWHSLTVTTT